MVGGEVPNSSMRGSFVGVTVRHIRQPPNGR